MKVNFRMFAKATAARDEQVAALQERLGLTQDPQTESRALLSGAVGADDDAVDRVRARLAYGEPARVGWSAGSVAMAAAALLAVAGAAGTSAVWWTTDPPLTAPLTAAALATANPTPYVALHYAGDGRINGTDEAPRIEWIRGVLSVEVEPNRGVQLSVHTSEAEVRVIGTGFDVIRDARGTRVSVEHGRVAVACEDGSGAVLQAGESMDCVPTTAAGLLGRAQALRQRGEPADAVLKAAELGLGASPDAPLGAELTLIRGEMLAALDRHAEAFAAANDAASAGAGARQRDLEHLAAREAVRAQGCDAALPLLRHLRDGAGASAAELVLLADCAAPTSRAEARAALIAALELGVPESQQDAVVDRLVRVGGEKP